MVLCGECLFWIELIDGIVYIVGVIGRFYGINVISIIGIFISIFFWYKNIIFILGGVFGFFFKFWIRLVMIVLILGLLG